MTFDLEKARDAAKFDDAEALRMFPDSLAEIERMRAELARVNQLREIEIDQAGASERIYLDAARLKDARIEELEAEAQEYHDRAEELATKLAKSWQITDEKRDAIEKAAHICHEVTAFDVAAALRAMLTEAE